MEKLFRRLIRTEIVLIYLVIVAGSIVRMSGSGMGCPDWPKCFGHLIPPTEMDQVIWKPNADFHKGRIIVHNEELLVAKEDIVTQDQINLDNWEAYTRHDYAIFNPTHTWIEYINRLIGALSGIPMLGILFLSLIRIRKSFLNFILAFLALALLGFEAWLGKYVVDGNLVPGHITMHMFGALAIVAVLMILLFRYSDRKEKKTINSWILMPISIGLLLVQVYLGTQVREQVDLLEKAGEIARSSFIESIGSDFLIHRSFSWSLVLVSGFFFWKNRGNRTGIIHLGATLFAVLVGVILAYGGMPRALQPVHLVWAALFFGWLFYHSIALSSSKK